MIKLSKMNKSRPLPVDSEGLFWGQIYLCREIWLVLWHS